MKKLTAILLSLVMLVSFASCGNNSNDPATPDDGNQTAVDNNNQSTETPAPSGLATGEWENNLGKFAVALVGAELFDDEDGAKAVRVYLDFTNKADSYTTSFTDEKNDVILVQGEEELDETDAPYGEDVAEYGNHKRNVRPGVTIRCIYQFALKEETGTVKFTLTAKNQENAVITYDFDLAALPGAPAEAFVAKEIAAPDFNNGWPESGEIKDYYSGQAQHNLVIKNAEFVDGTRDTKLIRVYYEFTNNKDEATDLFDAVDLRIFQDGIQLVEGQANELCESDLAFSKDVEAGQTVTVSNVYILISDSPVEVEANDIWDDMGIAKQFTVG